MSSNIPYSSADPRRHQDEDDQHDHDVPGHRISSPDHVDVEVPHAAGAVPSQQSRAHTSTVHLERVLPLWTPKRLQVQPTLYSLGTALVFSSERDAGPVDHPGGASANEEHR